MPDVRDTTRKLFEAMNNRDWDTIRGALHPDYVYIGPNGEETQGIEAGLAAGWTDNVDGFSDIRIDVKAVYGDGDFSVTEFDFTGTHDGPWAGVDPTGKRVEATVCNVMQFKDGKVYRERDYLDTLSAFAQLGVVDMPQL